MIEQILAEQDPTSRVRIFKNLKCQIGFFRDLSMWRAPCLQPTRFKHVYSTVYTPSTWNYKTRATIRIDVIIIYSRIKRIRTYSLSAPDANTLDLSSRWRYGRMGRQRRPSGFSATRLPVVQLSLIMARRSRFLWFTLELRRSETAQWLCLAAPSRSSGYECEGPCVRHSLSGENMQVDMVRTMSGTARGASHRWERRRRSAASSE